MSTVDNCQMCGKRFTWYWSHPHKCNACGKVFCDSCSEEYFGKLEVCKTCFAKFSKKIKTVKLVKSGHVGNHKTVKKFQNISTVHYYKDFDMVNEELSFQCLLLGGNAVLSKSFTSKKNEANNGYIYKTYRGHGISAIVEARSTKSKNNCDKCGFSLDIDANFCSKCGIMVK